MRHRSLFTGTLATIATLAFACAAFAQTCITGPETSSGPAELCAPAGYAVYYWAPPSGGVLYTQCITATETGAYSVRFGDSFDTLGEPCWIKFEIVAPPTCEITGPETVCKGSTVELCGPDGDFTYDWSGPGGFTASTRCITVGAEGTYDLTLTDNGTKGVSKCSHILKVTDCGPPSCPRTIGFWGQQALQRTNGSTKFTKAEVTAIAGCIDGKVAIFNWADDFLGFKSVILASSVDQRTQALRQFAGFLANVCTDELNLIANNGDEIVLDPGLHVTCGGEETTVGDLITSIDAELVSLAGQDLNLQSVKDAYSAIITCLDDINNGRGIGPVCDEVALANLTTSRAGETVNEAMGSAAVELYRAYPNPSGLTESVRIAYAIPTGGAQVRVGVYDLAGRLVQTLASGFQAAGRYELSWDGSAADGSRTKAGVYFVRGSAGAQRFQSRVLRVN